MIGRDEKYYFGNQTMELELLNQAFKTGIGPSSDVEKGGKVSLGRMNEDRNSVFP